MTFASSCQRRPTPLYCSQNKFHNVFGTGKISLEFLEYFSLTLLHFSLYNVIFYHFYFCFSEKHFKYRKYYIQLNYAILFLKIISLYYYQCNIYLYIYNISQNSFRTNVIAVKNK